MENVKAIMSSKFNDLFERWKKTIEGMGLYLLNKKLFIYIKKYPKISKLFKNK